MNKKKLQSIVNIMNTMRSTFSSFCCGFTFFCRFNLLKTNYIILNKTLEKGILISDRLLIRFYTSTIGIC